MQAFDFEKPLDLSKVPNQEILFRLEKLARSERKITYLVLYHINEVDSRKLYLGLGYNTLYKYLTQHLGYGERAAYDRMHAASLLSRSPSIGCKIEQGSLNLSQLVKVDQSLKQEDKAGKALSNKGTQELLAKIENKTLFETEKILACELNQTPRTHQKVKPQKDESVRLELTLNQEQYEILKKAQSLISHSVPENNLAEVLTYLAQAYIKKVEGSSKKVPSSKASPSQTEDLTQGFGKKPVSPSHPYKTLRRKRKSLSLKIRRDVFQKAQHCCEYVDPVSGKRCKSRFQLQVDHRRPLACGGSDEISNLRVLCGVCNRQEAQRWGLSRV
ncbi:MAG: HNH endonuclease [Pseudobdellovibrionaceae bacterium]